MITADVEEVIEQQIATEQTEFIAQFLFVRRCAGCAAPGLVGAFVDRHNALTDRQLADLESLEGIERCMVIPMDPTLCRGRLVALIEVGLLRDEVRPDIRLIWSEEALLALVARHRDARADQLGGLFPKSAQFRTRDAVVPCRPDARRWCCGHRSAHPARPGAGRVAPTGPR